MRFRMVNGNVVLRRLEPRKHVGSIILPDSAQKKSETAQVLECCRDPWVEDGQKRETILKPGDIVCVSKYAGQEFEIGGEGSDLNVVLMKEKDILCVLEDFGETAPTASASIPGVEPAYWESVPAA